MTEVLFICTHNSARSQIAEGLVNHFGSNLDGFSAGTSITNVNPFAISVLSEIGIDITHHSSKSIESFMDRSFDYVVTVCDNAKETCPFYPNAKEFIHIGFKDPSSISGTDEDILEAFRATRDKILEWLQIQFPLNITSKT